MAMIHITWSIVGLLTCVATVSLYSMVFLCLSLGLFCVRD